MAGVQSPTGPKKAAAVPGITCRYTTSSREELFLPARDDIPNIQQPEQQDMDQWEENSRCTGTGLLKARTVSRVAFLRGRKPLTELAHTAVEHMTPSTKPVSGMVKILP